MNLKVISVIFLLSISTTVFAHSGGLNSEGCHNNRKTGDYHCHRSSSIPKPRSSPTVIEKNNDYACSTRKKYCGEMTSCAEA